MEGHEFFARVTRVRAPEGFEEAVLGRLPAAREARARARRAAYRYAFAGSAALVLAAVLVFQPAAPEKDAVLSYAEREALTATPENGGRSAFDRNRFLPVYETMDYASEFRNVQARPRTVYILEQVSEIPSSEIIY
jgi:hypothetical protein